MHSTFFVAPFLGHRPFFVIFLPAHISATMKAVMQMGKIFNLSSSLPQRPQLLFTAKEIVEDIEVISSDEDFRNKLYLCINEKPPVQEQKYLRIEEFVKRTQDLEEVTVAVEDSTDEIKLLRKQLQDSLDQIKEEVQGYLKPGS